jgi:predicted GIY-YIG superfamily endonuclease
MSEQTLYRFYDENDNLLYVGITNTWYQRFHQHERKSGWFSHVTHATFESYESREAVEAAELVAIKTENPQFNKASNPAYEVGVNHFARLKTWTQTNSLPDSIHESLVAQMKSEWKELQKPKAKRQSKWVAMVFLNAFYDQTPWELIECRNCTALANSSNVNSWASQAFEELDGE